MLGITGLCFNVQFNYAEVTTTRQGLAQSLNDRMSASMICLISSFASRFRDLGLEDKEHARCLYFRFNHLVFENLDGQSP